MKSVFMPIHGQTTDLNGRTILLLYPEVADQEQESNLILRFAFVTRSKGGNVFPKFILDDWGREIRGIQLYNWVRNNGEQFPRAEIFGFEEDGQETQCFLRELELYARLPTYVYKEKMQPIHEGELIHSILLPSKSVSAPVKISKPSGINFPLRSAFVIWWQVPFNTKISDINLEESFPDPGF